MTRFHSIGTITVIVLFFFLPGCSSTGTSLKLSRFSLPMNYLYRPAYESIGRLYLTDPGLAISQMESRCRRDKKNLAYRLTLADMYKDRGRVNDAIAVWFEILALSRKGDAAHIGELPVYFIPIPPYQEEGMRPYGEAIDKTLVYYNMGLVYFQNGLFEAASNSFLEAAQTADDPDRKAELINRAAVAIGSRQVEYSVSDDKSRPYRTVDGKRVDADLLEFRKRERALYQVALGLPLTDDKLRQDIESNLALVEGRIERDGGVARKVQVGTEIAAAAAPPVETALAPSLPSTAAGESDRSQHLRVQALSLFRGKELEEAVALWQDVFAGFAPDAYMVEIELDCRTKSIYRTFGKIGEPGNFFIVPKVYNNTPCYRLLMGPYDSRDAANAEAEGLQALVPHLTPWVRRVEIPPRGQ